MATRTARVAAPPPILLSGAPDAIEAIVPVPSAQRRSVSLVLEEKEGTTRFRVLTTAVDESSTLVRLVASPTTRPGRYPGRITSAGGDVPVIVDVTAQPQVTVQPGTLAFRCAPGATERMPVAVQNLGNTRFAPRRAYAVGLLEEGAVEAAIGRGLRMRHREPGESRFEHAGDLLAEQYGGLARLRMIDLGEAVEPGETGHGTVEIRVEKEAKPGRRYHGLLILEGSGVPVTVITPRQPRSDDEPAATKEDDE